jgi:internalin A
MPEQSEAGRWRMALDRIEQAKRSMSNSLELPGLGLTSVPGSLAELRNLRLLSLRANQITAIPDFLAELTNLKFLDLSDNQITTIPDSLAQLVKIQVLRLGHNPLPEELLVAANGGVPRLFRYLRSIAEGKVYPRTIKLVLLGEPQSGKTTLLEALKGNRQPCDRGRPETLGVDVTTIEKRHPTDGRPMYLSVWDFAGQHIEHATHQFFLTENAIYLILWNSRQGTESGKRDLWYWLELLKMRVREPNFLSSPTLNTLHLTSIWPRSSAPTMDAEGSFQSR